MKEFVKRFLKWVLPVFVVSNVYGASGFYDGNLASATVCISHNYDLCVPQADKLSLEAVYFTVSPAAVSFTDGIRSTGSITITTNSGVSGSTLTIQGVQFAEGVDWTAGSVSSASATALYNIISSTYGAYSTGYIIVTSTTGISASSFTVRGVTFRAGTDWAVGATTSTTAASIQTKLSSYFAGTLLVTRNYSTVYLTYYAYGKIGNYASTSYSSSITVSGMSGGRPGPLSGISFSLTPQESVIYATSTVVGSVASYTIASSTPTALTVTGISGGMSADINYVTNRINKINMFPTGLAVLYTVSKGNTPTGLTANTTYYAIAGDGTYFSLATSQANAALGTAIDLYKSAGDDKGTFILTPLAIDTANYGLRWEASNDGDNFFDLNKTSITYSSAGSYGWDLGDWNYKYLRANFSAGISGCIKLILHYFGKY